MRDFMLHVVWMLVSGVLMGGAVLVKAMAPQTFKVMEVKVILAMGNTLFPAQADELEAIAKANGASQSVLHEIEQQRANHIKKMEDRAQRRVML